MATQYFIVNYDNEATGPFVAEGENITWNAGSDIGFIVSLIDTGVTGTLYCALVDGVLPVDNDVLTQGTTTADADGDGILIDYNAYIREDMQWANTGAITWTGPALGATHSFNFDGQTTNVTAGEILTFDSGETCELITIESDAGATGELSVRFISPVDVSLPIDNASFTGSLGGDGVVNGVIHQRVYRPYDMLRWSQDLGDNADISGDDDWSRVDYIPASKDTEEIINLKGTINVDATVIQHMFGGSISQDSANHVFSGLNVQVTSPNSDTQPILIKDDLIITDYWKNAFMPDSIKGNIRIMVETKKDGVAFDGQRIKGRLGELGQSFFVGSTTLGLATTALALFSSNDGNNQTDEATLAGVPYSSIVLTEGYQTIDYNNENGPTPFAFKLDFGSASSLQAYERTKYIQRRGTAETLFGRDASYFDGINLNFPYDGGVGTFTEDEKVVWGTVIAYDTQATNLTVGEVITFSGGSRGRLLYQNDGGATGTLILDMDGNALPTATETMTGITSGGDGTVATVGANTNAGTGTLVALLDNTGTGNLYISRLTGLLPIDNSEIYGNASNANCLVNGTPLTRTINNQFWGVYTGANHQTNFGLGLDATDAIVGDKFPNLVGAEQEPPNNQSGSVTGLKTGDTVTVYPWDGTSHDVNGDAEPFYAEATLTTALTAGVSTEAVVDAIPDNTPASGFLRIERDSDGNVDLVEYSSYSALTYTLVGTAPSTATIGNNVMRALIDKEMAVDGAASYTAVKGAGDTKVTIKVQNGYTAAKNGPIKPYPTTATFGNNGFSVGATRTSDA